MKYISNKYKYLNDLINHLISNIYKDININLN